MTHKEKKIYSKPHIEGFILDRDISLVFMTYNDPYNPPDNEQPPGGTTQQVDTFNENRFEETNLK